MPQKAKSRIGRPTRRTQDKSLFIPLVHSAAEAQPLEEPLEEPLWGGLGRGEYAEARMRLYAELAWLTDYTSVLNLEAEMNGAAMGAEEHMSGYRRREIQRSAGGEEVHWKAIRRVSHDHERLLREKNVHYVPFSQAVLSVSYLVDQVSESVWERDRKNRRVVSRVYATQLLWTMLGCRPPPKEPANIDIDFFVYDQTYAVEGGGHGAGSTLRGARGIGRIDSNGERIRVKRETYINAFEVFVSQRECTLSDAARAAIERRGPYTQDFSRIKPVLVPARSEAFVDTLLIDACAALKPARPALCISWHACAYPRRRQIHSGL